MESILTERVASEAAERLGVPVFLVVPYGLTPYFTAFHGTITITVTVTVRTYMRCLSNKLSADFMRRF